MYMTKILNEIAKNVIKQIEKLFIKVIFLNNLTMINKNMIITKDDF